MTKRDFSPLAGRDLASVLADLEACAATPFAEARPMPAATFHAESFLRREVEAVFATEWICLGRADDISEPGDFIGHQIAGVPVLAVRQHEGGIKVFSQRLRPPPRAPYRRAQGQGRPPDLPLSRLDL